MPYTEPDPIVSCQFCSAAIELTPSTKLLSFPTDQGETIFVVCLACGRLQPPRLIKDGHLSLADVTPEELAEIQKAYDAQRKLRSN